MGPQNQRCRCFAALTLSTALALGACDPASSLENQEYRAYLDSYLPRDLSVVVAAFNQFDTKRVDFDCVDELEASKRAAWREEPGRMDRSGTREAQALNECMQRFFEASGVRQGMNETKVLPQWMSHNFLPEIRTRLDEEVASAQKRVSGAGCGGEVCESFTVVGDLVVPRAGAEKTATWSKARNRCRSGNTSGISQWRLPTKAELEAMRQSARLASDVGFSQYWAAERELAADGSVKAWSLDMMRPLPGAKAASPAAVAIDGTGRQKRLKVRCVHDLASTKVPSNEVDELELALEAIQCPTSRWEPALRLRKGLLVTWQSHAATGRTMDETCGEIDWCGLSWSPPSTAQARALAADPWFARDPQERCVARPPGS